MMGGLLAPVLKQKFFDSNGNPLSGGLLYSYEAGTTTPKATYSDQAVTTPNTNPIVLNSNGECDLWLIAGVYKFVLKDSADVTQWTQDNISIIDLEVSGLTSLNDVQYKTFADTPIAITTDDSGILYSVNASGGNVVINLPSLSAIDYTNGFAIGVKKTDSSQYTITVNPDASDVIDGDSSKVIGSQHEGFMFLADTDASPDEWTTMSIGLGTSDLYKEYSTGTATTTTPGIANRVHIGQGDAIIIDENGLIRVKDGSVSAPSICFQSDTNNGMYYVAADQWALACGGYDAISMIKAVSAYANVGLGGALATTSDAIPLYLRRDQAAGTNIGMYNLSTGAGCYTGIQFTTDTGANENSSGIFAYSKAMYGILPSLGGKLAFKNGDYGISFIPYDTNGVTEFYAGGQALSDLQMSIDKTTINMNNLPVSGAGLAAGDLWDNEGALNVGPDGASSSQGSKNYFKSSNSDINVSVADWLTDNGAGSAAVGLALAITSTSGEVLSGANSLKITKDAANRLGEFIKCRTETIDPFDAELGVLYGEFDFNPISGYVAGDYILEIYDVTNSAVLFAGQSDDLEIPNITGKFQYVAHLESTTALIELRLKVNNTNTNAITVSIDEVKLGPAGAAVGYISSDAIDFTPTFTNFTLGNGTLDISKHWRKGGRMIGKVKVTLGSTSSMGSSPTMTVPGGESVDTNIMAVSDSSNTGGGRAVDTGTANYKLSLELNSATEIAMYVEIASSTYVKGAGIGSTVPMTWTTGDVFDFDFDIPIDGWFDSSVMNTNQLHLQGVSAFTTDVTPSGTLTSSYETAIFGTVTKDLHGIYNTTTGQATMPRDGVVDVDAFVQLGYTAASGVDSRIRVINTTTTKAVYGWMTHQAISGGSVPDASGTLEVSKGDIIEVQTFCSGASATYNAATSSFSIRYQHNLNVLGVVKDSIDEGVILNGGAGFASTNTEVVEFTTVEKDTSPHLTVAQSATLGDSVTVKTKGLYFMSWYIKTGGAASDYHIYKNSITVGTVDETLLAGCDGTDRHTISCTDYLTPGDIIRCLSSTGVAPATSLCVFRIIKIG